MLVPRLLGSWIWKVMKLQQIGTERMVVKRMKRGMGHKYQCGSTRKARDASVRVNLRRDMDQYSSPQLKGPIIEMEK